MSGLYNAIFGESGIGDILLTSLGLTQPSVGRYRDAWVEKDRIVIYTRNGGGNHEECSCTGCHDGWASHHYPVNEKLHEYRHTPTSRSVVISESENLRTTKWEKIPESEQVEVVEMQPWCVAPESAGCACTACISNYVLPAHPLHLGGEDDEFDCTYRREFFSHPKEFAAELAKIALNEPIDPSERWLTMIDKLREAK